MALTDLTRISTSGIATGTSLSGAILHGDAHFRGDQVGINSAIFDSSERELSLKDNVKLTFGDKTNGDLSIHHSGVNSFIDETGTGSLYVSAASDIFLRSHSTNLTMFRGTAGGEAGLYHANNKKIHTTSTGAIVTGILTATEFSGQIRNPSGISTFYNLTVTNNLTVEGTTTTLDTNLIDVDRVEVGANSNSIVGVAITQSGTADIINLFDGGTEVLTVTDGGKVGIGVTNPDHNLHAYQSAGDAVVTIESQGNNNHAALEFIRTSSGGDSKGAGSIYVTGDTSASEARMHFGVGHNISHGQLPRMTIMGNGEVGIGTINPNAQVHIEADTPFLRLEDTSGGSKRLDLWVEHSDGYVGTNQSASDLHFETAGVIRQTIKSTGKIGIGVSTPEELLDLGESNQQNLKVGQRGYLGQAYSTSATILGHSVKAKTTGTTSGGMEVTETNSGGGAPSAIRQESGTIQFHTAGSGTSGAAFDSERLRITGLGDLYAGNGAGYAIWDNSTSRPRFQFRQGTGTNRGFALLEERGDANSMSLYIAKSRDGNGAGVITSGDQLGTIQFTGADGTNQVTGAQILAWTSGTIAADRIPTNLSVYTHGDNTSGALERLRIVTSGEMGLGTGTIDPDGNQLLIRTASTFQTNKGHIMLTGDSATVGQGPQIVFSESGSGSSYAGGYVGFVRQGGNSVGDLVFGTRDVQGDATTVPGERLRIRSSGQVCLGTTSGPGQIGLYLGDGTNPAGHIYANGTHHMYILANAYHDGAWKYLGNGEAQSLSITDGDFSFHTASANGNGAGQALTWTTRMTVSSNQNVYINGSQTGNDRAILYNGSGFFGIYGSSDGSTLRELRFHTGGGGASECARFSSGGQLSIGKGAAAQIAAQKGIEISGGTTAEIRLKNSSGGTGSSDGFAIQKWSNGNNYIYDYDANNIIFGTTNVSRAQMTKEGRWIITPDGGVINGANSAFSLQIVQAGNYSYGGSATGTYPGIHIKSTTTGGGNGVAMWTPDNNWGLWGDAGSKTGLAIAPNTNSASSGDTKFFLTQDGHMATGRDTYNQIDNAAKCMSSASVAGGGLNLGGHNLQNAIGKDHRVVLNWYQVAESTGAAYHHLVTSLWGGGSPSGNIAHIMGGFTIKGYSYGGTYSGISNNNGLSNEDIYFHNWSGAMHGYERYYYGSGFDPGNAAYVNSNGYVTLRLRAGRYVCYQIDLYQFAVYAVRDIYVTSHTMDGNSTI